ncbi:DUF262 domain-containing protein [Vibrio crassostreae]|uniref:DUF262 domain-containing protein n=1 Tax=Vibrio crassostreae TaxID=246167 RepID=UPI000F4739A9|nr:DUF262 domain-containing protein [Vibrio crassostreae]ROO50010.1 uncharacterized protein DUF1524 [Vibrio crassostreae]CAK1755312.1 DUF262 domain-containing protein [Vibrio crassostreae]CAK1775021.1 DUF262 domain-containing protein [Vibrio crassostreae]CAK2644953.1 DUF262 domain-containing protein [Vibrio crassostreae]CAK3138105.1 DUF262 domain-containing protein [Vibrio crassostreae]
MDISPDKQNIDSVFSNTLYHIDFYQREYRWTNEPVERLLDDVFFKFNEIYTEYGESIPASANSVDEKYPWYYLNTYVTNKVEGKVFIVDGQQRLTTLSLVLIKLLHLARHFSSKAEKWLDNKVCGQSGFENCFWMNHEAHTETQQALYSNKLEDVDTNSGVTAINMVKNFNLLSTWLDKHLDSQHKFETFVFYFLRRLVLINLTVEQTDVPMVFEVINDRGVRLKPFEILKGKLLGQVDKAVLVEKEYNSIWEKRIRALNEHSEDESDRFFRFYLKARFADTRRDGQRFDGDYHRIMFTRDFDDKLELAHNPKGVMSFLDGAFQYYSELYNDALNLFKKVEDNAFTYNRVNDIDGAFMLLMSSCKIGDIEREEKLKAIPLELDRVFSLLQLQAAYDSNSFQEMLYRISAKIRSQPLSEVRSAFEGELIDELSKRRLAEVEEPFKYSFFKQAGNGLNARFKRYFFARVEQFLAENMNLNMKHPFSDLVTKTGAKTGFHIEHILAYNEDNIGLFEGDEERFEVERNRLGGMLLLKGKDNISSNNEPYSEKLKSYANTLYWNETLREDSYKSKLDLQQLQIDFDLNLRPLQEFGSEALEERQKLLFEISKIMWA